MADLDVMRYPTGDKLIDDLTEFCGARLKSIYGEYPRAHNDRPCLAEDWWVEAKMIQNISFPLEKLDREAALRICWRWARNRNVESGAILSGQSADDAADLLLHQMAELMPTMFAMARAVRVEQPTRHSQGSSL